MAAAARPEDVLRIRYALAKELEDVGDAAGSLHHLHAANNAHKRAIGHDFSQDAAIFDAIEALFGGGGAPFPVAGSQSGEAPIFVVGMPRTGTTLVDRVLSSHRDVEAAGELQAMPLAVKQLAAEYLPGTPSRRVIDPETIVASAALIRASSARRT